MAGRKPIPKDKRASVINLTITPSVKLKLVELKKQGIKFNRSKFFTEKFEKEFKKLRLKIIFEKDKN